MQIRIESATGLCHFSPDMSSYQQSPPLHLSPQTSLSRVEGAEGLSMSPAEAESLQDQVGPRIEALSAKLDEMWDDVLVKTGSCRRTGEKPRVWVTRCE